MNSKPEIWKQDEPRPINIKILHISGVLQRILRSSIALGLSAASAVGSTRMMADVSAAVTKQGAVAAATVWCLGYRIGAVAETCQEF